MRFQLSQMRGMSLMNICIFLLLITWIFKVWKTRKLFEINNLNIYLFLIVLIAFLSVPIQIIKAEIPGRSLMTGILDVKNWANPLIIFLCLINTLKKKQIKYALMGLIIFVIITVIPLLIDVFGITKLSFIRDVQPGRAAGFAEANQYASFLVLFLPIILSLFLFQKGSILNKIFWAFVCAMIFVALFITGSRGGILSFIFSIAFYLWFLVKEKKISLIAIVGTIVIMITMSVVAYTIAPIKIKETVNHRFNPYNYKNLDELSNSRLQNLRNGLPLFLDSPIWGHGLNTFVPLEKLHHFETQFSTHNEYLSYLIYFGILGLIIFVIIQIKIFNHVWCHLRKTDDPWMRILYASYLAGFFGYAFSMFFLEVFAVNSLFWIYTAIIYKCSELKNNKNYISKIVITHQTLEKIRT